MIKIKFIVWARSSSIDNQTNNLSIFEIIEEITAPQFPGALIESKLIVLFERDVVKDPSICECTLKIKVSGKEIGSQNIQLDFKGLKRNRLIISIPVINLEKEGAIEFFITLKNKELGSYLVPIVLQPV